MSVLEQTRATVSKKPTVVLSAMAVWVVLVFAIIWPWVHRFDRADLTFSLLAHLSAVVWWLVLFWAFHHLAFEVYGLFRRTGLRAKDSQQSPSIAILYTTCDDFNRQSCQSCLDQDYPNCRVLVCDDSQQDGYKRSVEEFCSQQGGRCVLIRRPNRRGFKAGNLNNAIRHHVKEDWVLLVDADQLLPCGFLSQLVRALPDKPDNIAFVQAAHKAQVTIDSSLFQQALALDVSLFYLRDLAVRESFGFVPLLGHGALIRTPVLEAVAGFPEVVSEDFALSLVFSSNNQRGSYVGHVASVEALPFDFGGFMTRIRKFAGGTAELVRHSLGPFLFGPGSWVEKWDFLMMIGWYVMPVVVTANGFLSAYVCHALWKVGQPYLHPLLPPLFVWLWLSLFSLSLSVADTWWGALRFYFWSTAVYAAALPLTGFSFVKHLFVKPSFERTPKNREAQTLRGLDIGFMVGLGLAALVLSVVWFSPFTPLLAGQGVAYLCYPLYGRLCVNSLAGRVARILVYLPGILAISALYTMWAWNYF